MSVEDKEFELFIRYPSKSEDTYGIVLEVRGFVSEDDSLEFCAFLENLLNSATADLAKIGESGCLH